MRSTNFLPPLLLLEALLGLLVLASAVAGGAATGPGGGFQQVAKLVASDGSAGDEFGWDVNLDGDLAIVGAAYDDDLGGSSGAAYIFERDAGGPGAWGQVAKLTAPGGGPEEFFGWRVAISGEAALVGAPRSGVETPGSAYLFERSPGTGAWNFVTELTMGEGGDNFGVAVALQGDTALVGASGTDGPDSQDGAVFVYRRDSGGPGAWGQVAKLTAAVECADSTTPCGWWGDDSFPSSQGLDVDGDLVVGSSSGPSNRYAYAFKSVGAEPEAGRRVARAIPADFVTGDKYGTSSAVVGETLLVGAFLDDELGVNSGAAYIFERDPGGPSPWAEVAKLKAPDAANYDWFGLSVEMSGDLAAVGATQETRFDQPGYAWVFERDAGGPDQWGAIAKLVAADGMGGDSFGSSVTISGETVIVGAYRESGFGLYSGAAYVFERVPALSTDAGPARAPDAGGPGRPAGDRPSCPHGAQAPRTLPVGSEDEELLALGLVGGPMSLNDVVAHGGPICFQLFAAFVPYHDDLELTVSGGQVTGLWRNALDDGTDFPISGVLQPGRALVRCDAGVDPCPFGTTYGFIIDLPLDGTLDMLRLEGGLWNAWIDEITYVVSEGPCP